MQEDSRAIKVLKTTHAHRRQYTAWDSSLNCTQALAQSILHIIRKFDSNAKTHVQIHLRGNQHSKQHVISSSSYMLKTTHTII